MDIDPEIIRLIIADDDRIVREGLVQMISQVPDMTVVEQAENGDELLDKIRKLDPLPDLVLLDLNMPAKDGWEVMRQLNIEFPDLPFIIISVQPEEEFAVPCFKEGASGYLHKLGPLDKFEEAIRQVTQGKKFISPQLAEKIAFGSEKKPHEKLSPREFQVFCLIASGKSVHEIAGQLSRSPATISTYRTRILEKMNLNSNAQLTHYAFQNKILK